MSDGVPVRRSQRQTLPNKRYVGWYGMRMVNASRDRRIGIMQTLQTTADIHSGGLSSSAEGQLLTCICITYSNNNKFRLNE